mmetsp:Transcript_11169/g.27022  ORF Transcript_11169/g.27022 Transcript_11169/m.27022 type:complete len:270 (+) Transcript_11169:1242-2051(+)
MVFLLGHEIIEEATLMVQHSHIPHTHVLTLELFHTPEPLFERLGDTLPHLQITTDAMAQCICGIQLEEVPLHLLQHEVVARASRSSRLALRAVGRRRGSLLVVLAALAVFLLLTLPSCFVFASLSVRWHPCCCCCGLPFPCTVPEGAADLHEQHTQLVLPLSVAHAPKLVIPRVALLKMTVSSGHQSVRQLLVRCELGHQKLFHDVDAGRSPVRSELDFLAGALRFSWFFDGRDVFPVPLVHALGRLKRMLYGWVGTFFEGDGTWVEVR